MVPDVDDSQAHTHISKLRLIKTNTHFSVGMDDGALHMVWLVGSKSMQFCFTKCIKFDIWACGQSVGFCTTNEPNPFPTILKHIHNLYIAITVIIDGLGVVED